MEEARLEWDAASEEYFLHLKPRLPDPAFTSAQQSLSASDVMPLSIAISDGQVEDEATTYSPASSAYFVMPLDKQYAQAALTGSGIVGQYNIILSMKANSSNTITHNQTLRLDMAQVDKSALPYAEYSTDNGKLDWTAGKTLKICPRGGLSFSGWSSVALMSYNGSLSGTLANGCAAFTMNGQAYDLRLSNGSAEFDLGQYLAMWKDSARNVVGYSNAGAVVASSATEQPGDFLQVSAGTQFTCALKKDRTIHCWGANGIYEASTPPTGNDFSQVSSGYSHACTLKADNSITCWGNNENGKATTPEGNDFTAVSSGNTHTCALRNNGSIVCWGSDEASQSSPPAENVFSQISNGSFHSCALKNDGSINCWGSNSYGQIDFPSGNDFIQVSSGGNHTCGLKQNGSIICWGWNLYEQINSPTTNDFIEISSGNTHSCAVNSNKEVICWGKNTNW